jgi:hypothetical protein
MIIWKSEESQIFIAAAASFTMFNAAVLIATHA